jgi:hypothetical protein
MGEKMSDITPKFKLYLFISIIAMIISIGCSLTTMIYNNSFDIGLLLVGLGASFIPFVSTISIILSSNDIPTEVIAFLGIITTIISIIQTFLIAMFILQSVHNLIWNPDV